MNAYWDNFKAARRGELTVLAWMEANNHPEHTPLDADTIVDAIADVLHFARRAGYCDGAGSDELLTQRALMHFRVEWDVEEAEAEGEEGWREL